MDSAGPPTNLSADTDYGGYNVGKATVYNTNRALNAVELSALKCSKCTLLLKEPRQVITCGHRYCKSCIEQLTSGSEGPYSCLVDQEDTFLANEIRNDKGCLRDIQSLEVDCPTDQPCGWRGKLTDVETHRESCPNKKIKCSLGCGRFFQNGDLEGHMLSDCPKRLCQCQHCNGDIPLDGLQEHYGVCEQHPVRCDYCQKELPARKQLTSHLEQDCEEYYMECSHTTCDFKGRKSDMMQHILAKHLIQYLERMNGMEAQMMTLQSENKALLAENKAIREEVVGVRNTVSGLQAKIDKLTQANQTKDVDIASLKSIVKELQNEKDERDLAMVPSRSDFVERDGPARTHFRDGVTNAAQKARPTTLPDPDDAKKMSKYRAILGDEAALKALEGPTYSSILREPVHSVTGMPDLIKPGANMTWDMETLQSQVRKLSDMVETVQGSHTRFGVAIDEVRLRQDVLDVKTTNGILIWKIPDIRRRYRDAIDRRTISLYSPPFYTSPHGYRMCIRTYLNGDGIGKGTHISLFFVIMRSEQDNLLPWPFKQSVRFTLVNQKNPASSITEAFIPDLKSPSFQKPENDMNIASGFPKFARQNVLSDESFTCGNMIYIKCQVDLAGLAAQ